MTRAEIILELAQTGILQFGHFTDAYGKPAAPVRFKFTLLPSFPSLMKQIVQLVVPFLSDLPDDGRLLTTRNTIPLGAVVGAEAEVPLLFPHGDALSFTHAFTIEGAADVDNPIILLTDVLLDGSIEQEMASRSDKIGLPVGTILSVLDCELGSSSALREVHTIKHVFTLAEVAETLAISGYLTPSLTKTVRQWAATPATSHPN